MSARDGGLRKDPKTMPVIKEDSMKRTRFSCAGGGIWALLFCVIALAGAALLPSAASANTYNVVACNDAPAGANHSWSPWWNSGVSTIVVASGCPNAGYDGNTNKGMFARYIAGS
ncbi:MAG TPA: hypothetical protein VE662_07395, partial [Solirubrobacterales bacterium]|nr:hypothetical protein [Solirubrobacterales bacterium]